MLLFPISRIDLVGLFEQNNRSYAHMPHSRSRSRSRYCKSNMATCTMNRTKVSQHCTLPFTKSAFAGGGVLVLGPCLPPGLDQGLGVGPDQALVQIAVFWVVNLHAFFLLSVLGSVPPRLFGRTAGRRHKVRHSSDRCALILCRDCSLLQLHWLLGKAG